MARYFEYGDEAIEHLKARDAKLGAAIDAIGHVYHIEDDGTIVFEDAPTFVGDAPNFMEHTNDLDELEDEDEESPPS